MANTKIQSEQIADDVALAGSPTTTTQSASDNSTKVATTAYVTTAVANLVDSAPSSLNTLNELAAAMNDNASFFSTVLPLSGGTMTGNIAHASDFTLDVGGDITLDADGGDIRLSDGGTQFGKFTRDGGDFLISSSENDKDMKFAGADGGANITALTLDMSAAGAASFNAGATFGGNVGIGVTPSAPLDVVTNSTVWTGEFTQSNTSNGDGVLISVGSTAAADYALSVRTNAGAHSGLAVKADGHVGIGNFSPDELLHLQQTSGTTIVKTEVASNSTIGFEIKKTGSTTSNWRIVDGQTVNGKLEIYDVTNSRSVMTFDQNGNAGIGTISPVNNGTNSHGLTINGTGNYQNIALQKSGATQFLVYLNGTGGTFIDQVTDDPMMFLTNDTERLRINTDGSVQLLHTTAGNLTSGNARAGAVLKLHHEAQWENGYTGGDFLGGIEFSSGDSSGGEGVRAAIKTSVDTYYNTNKMRFYVAQSNSTNLVERLELQDSLIFKGRTGTSPAVEMINFDAEDTDTGRETTLRFKGHRSGGELMTNAQISGHHQGNADDDRGELKFWTNTGSGGLTEKVQIESGGDVRVKAGSLVVETSGKGIFLGGTAAVNELDDFETGTWTPTLIAATTNPTGGGALAPSGTYTKIGNRVWLTFYVGRSWTNSPSGGVFLANLPFTVHSTSPNAYFATVTTYKVDFGTANIPFLIPSAGQTNAALYTAASGGTWSQLTWQSHMTSSAGSYITGTIHYVVA